MSKRALLVLILGVSVLVTSCGSPATPTQETTPEAAAPTEVATTEAPTEAATKAADVVTLTMGSWRTDDVDAMNKVLAAFSKDHPNIKIEFDPTNPPDYNAALQTQFEGGTAPDLMYTRSFSPTDQLYASGYLASLQDLPGLKDAFTDQSLEAWSTPDGVPYSVPIEAVSHGIYYNKDVFDANKIAVPMTWEELLDASKKLKDAGVTPFANGTGEAWTDAEILFMNLAPDFIGGHDGRIAYLKGDRCFNDASVVSAFQAVADIAPYLPKDQASLKYNDQRQVFLQGQAAMWFGGSWDVSYFESQNPTFKWGVFAVPAPKGQPQFVTFHLDAGMGMNKNTKHPEEAKAFLEWMTTPDFAKAFGNALPGFFPLNKQAPTLDDAHASEFLALNNGRGTDVRWAWQGLLSGDPNGYNLMQDNTIAVINGTMTPKQAADGLQDGLAKWFKPAQTCKK